MTSDLLASILGDDAESVQAPEPARVLEFQIHRQVLLPLLERAITVIPTRDVMPVLKCFQMHVDPQRLRLIASDAEMTLLVSTQDVATSLRGVAVFPAKRFLEIVKCAEDYLVVVKVKGTVATIVIGRAVWTLTLPSGADYPPMPAIADAQFTGVDRLAFLEALVAVRYAASRDPARANLAIIDIADGKLTASDGVRIHQVSLAELDVKMRIPIAAVDDLLRLLRACDRDTVLVGQSENKLIFRLGPDVFIVSKLHAQFPDMQAMLLRPALENKQPLWVSRTGLANAIRRVRINADSDSAAIALVLTAQQVTVMAQDRYSNTASEVIPADYDGPDRTLVVHHGFLTEMIYTYGDSTCVFRLGDDTKTRRSPLLLRHEESGSIAVTQQMQSDWSSARR